MKHYKCILLVDDDSVSNFLNKKILSTLAIMNDLHTATNGQEAIEFINNNAGSDCPDLIFLDINMPVMDGFQFLEEFQQFPAQQRERIEIIVLTSSSNKKDVEKAYQFPILGYLNKPLTIENVKSVLSAAS